MNPPTGKSSLALHEGYADWLGQLKVQIVQARQRASLSVSAELVQLYGRVFFCPALPGWSIWAAACCPIAVVPYRDPAELAGEEMLDLIAPKNAVTWGFAKSPDEPPRL